MWSFTYRRHRLFRQSRRLLPPTLECLRKHSGAVHSTTPCHLIAAADPHFDVAREAPLHCPSHHISTPTATSPHARPPAQPADTPPRIAAHRHASPLHQCTNTPREPHSDTSPRTAPPRITNSHINTPFQCPPRRSWPHFGPGHANTQTDIHQPRTQAQPHVVQPNRTPKYTPPMYPDLAPSLAAQSCMTCRASTHVSTSSHPTAITAPNQHAHHSSSTSATRNSQTTRTNR